MEQRNFDPGKSSGSNSPVSTHSAPLYLQGSKFHMNSNPWNAGSHEQSHSTVTDKPKNITLPVAEQHFLAGANSDPASFVPDPWTHPGHLPPDFPSIPSSPLGLLTPERKPTFSPLIPQSSDDFDVIELERTSERGGGVIFKHVQYNLKSRRLNSQVLRRYSDFVWLLDILLKKYPFRIIPPLPPKKIVGKFLFKADEGFLNKRKIGLARFINLVSNHPRLRYDSYVLAFLAEKDIQEYRRISDSQPEEEFIDEDFISEEGLKAFRAMPNVETILANFRKDMPRQIAHFQRISLFLERYSKIAFVISNDLTKYGAELRMMSQEKPFCQLDDNCRMCNVVFGTGFRSISQHVDEESHLQSEYAKSLHNLALERIQKFIELMQSFQELFERRDRMDLQNLDLLSKRISNNEEKLNLLDQSQEEEMAKLATIISQEKQEFAELEKRKKLIQFCVYEEYLYLHNTIPETLSALKKMVNEQIYYSTQMTDNWRRLMARFSSIGFDMEVSL